MKGFYFYNNVKSFLLMQGKKKKRERDFTCSLSTAKDTLQATEKSLLNFIDFFPSV